MIKQKPHPKKLSIENKVIFINPQNCECDPNHVLMLLIEGKPNEREFDVYMICSAEKILHRQLINKYVNICEYHS